MSSQLRTSIKSSQLRTGIKSSPLRTTVQSSQLAISFKSSRLRATVRIAEGGRIVIPAHVRRCLGLKVGTSVVMTVEDDHATLMNVEASRQRAKQRIQRYVRPGGTSVSEELMAERKKEAQRE